MYDNSQWRYSHYIDVVQADSNFHPVFVWCKENCSKRYSFWRRSDQTYRFYFEDNQDYIHFKLMWGEFEYPIFFVW